MSETLTASDFELATCQATIFTPEEEVSGARLVRDLLPRWADRFDADPLVIPLVDGLPRDAPRVVLQNKSTSWRCEIASSRISIVWKKTPEGEGTMSSEEFFREAVAILEDYMHHVTPRVGRMAAVLTSYAEHDSAALFLARHFCKKRWKAAPLNRPEHFELHAHKRFNLGDTITVNSWVRSKTGIISVTEQARPVVLVEQDINTLFEELETQNFSIEDVGKYFSLATREFPVILELYYPEG